jgi:tetratricopeptide (TPR) repeat protein
MRRVPRLAIAAALLASAALLCAAAPARAQGRFPPDSLVNLKFFPRTIGVRDLIDTMRFFTSALGVRCQFCHVGREGMPLDSFDFRSDDKRTKRTARVMLDMVHHINMEHLMEVPERPVPNVQVTCVTCHRGVARPVALWTLIAATARENGLDSAVKAYRGLRDRYYGRAAYDFGETSLTAAAEELRGQGRFDDAIGILRLNAEFYPTSGQVLYWLGETYLAKADTANAVTNYRQALQKEPRLFPAARRLRDLGQSPN